MLNPSFKTPHFVQTDIEIWATAAELIQRSFITMVIAYIAMHLLWTRQMLRGTTPSWKLIGLTILFFSSFAAYGTHSGLLVNYFGQVLGWTPKFITEELKPEQAIIGFRDAMTLVAGLTGGVWVGLGTGLLAAMDCYFLDGFAKAPFAIVTVMIGLFAGITKYFFPKWTMTLKGTAAISIVATVIQQHILQGLLVPYPFNNVIYLMLIVNCLTCCLFFLILNDLERDKLLYEAQQMQNQLLAFQAQVEPHFLNNTLASIQGLISTHPENARAYLAKLATFFNETRESAGLQAITIEQELLQIQHYMEFQQLRFQEKVTFEMTVSADIFDYEIPPRCLQTLVENALTHGRRGLTHPLSVIVKGQETKDRVILQVQDNGNGIRAERLALLTKQIVLSEYSNGTALYYLQQSLSLSFSGQAKLTIESILEQGTTITIQFPKELK